jgi:succinate-semialdehyde dehydrogenase/glutarate-semialdehyde dehydrogenase
MRAYESVNPFNEELLSAFDFIQADEVDIILEDAHDAFLTWRKLGFKERALYIERLAKLLRENASELAEIASIEMGKLLAHSKAEVLKSASVCDYVVAEAEKVRNQLQTIRCYFRNISMEFSILAGYQKCYSCFNEW